ncbi:ParA family protein [Desulfobotulus sp. H1]|uniref:ParA family protein n=1 Tax=Desulfobotulus pelophilus TaxID=2823377 RepID=A0ABT3N8U5_9BACT|nr:ParA family protein [Desulfobotulus pelophilus]MCW7753879.1 ParA family protein [Desulfobotulus pelophilus]
MARIICFYNNKGGVGKTTLSLFFADFLSSVTIQKKKSRVLVIDFDPQASCCNAILGPERSAELRTTGRTLPHAIREKRLGRKVKILDYIVTRKEDNRSRTKKVRLGNLDAMVADPEEALHFDETGSLEDSLDMAAWLRSSLAKEYDFIIVDLPAALSRRNGFSLIGAFMADYFMIPLEPNRINTNAIPLTLKMMENIRQWRGEKRSFELLGFILNKADRRTKQYRRHKEAFGYYADLAGTRIYDNVLPPAPALSNASDDSIHFITLTDRYEAYYPHVKKLVLEVIPDMGFAVKARQDK